MNIQHLQLVSAAGQCVDGIDVAQLLLDLGEASAASSAIDLFGLCQNAQRVIGQVLMASTLIAVSDGPIGGSSGQRGEPYAL